MKTILVLDDDPIIRKSLRGNLSHYGYDVVEASSVPEAISSLRQKDISLAIVDIKMPMMGGYDFCRHMRDNEKHAKIPIIILTGVGGPEGAERAKRMGINAYLTKPYDLEKLLATIGELIV